jgi:hypothetical protein
MRSYRDKMLIVGLGVTPGNNTREHNESALLQLTDVRAEVKKVSVGAFAGKFCKRLVNNILAILSVATQEKPHSRRNFDGAILQKSGGWDALASKRHCSGMRRMWWLVRRKLVRPDTRGPPASGGAGARSGE